MQKKEIRRRLQRSPLPTHQNRETRSLSPFVVTLNLSVFNISTYLVDLSYETEREDECQTSAISTSVDGKKVVGLTVEAEGISSISTDYSAFKILPPEAPAFDAAILKQAHLDKKIEE